MHSPCPHRFLIILHSLVSMQRNTYNEFSIFVINRSTKWCSLKWQEKTNLLTEWERFRQHFGCHTLQVFFEQPLLWAPKQVLYVENAIMCFYTSI